ncbi:MAG: ribosome recycling factor [Bacteriovoracaceae bacterium]|nr:ribosome recycling factor [Bacteriovoracaceae bacterium]
MLDKIKKEIADSFEKISKTLQNNLSRVRTGRANPSVLDGLVVDYYGSQSPLKNVAQVSVPEARLLQIQPFDKSMIAAIEKSIMSANLGMTPTNDGNVVRIPFAQLTEDKRKTLVKDVKKIGEDAKVSLRNLRRDQNEAVKKSEKDKKISEDESKKWQQEIQNLIDKYTKQIDDQVSAKEKEVMTI